MGPPGSYWADTSAEALLSSTGTPTTLVCRPVRGSSLYGCSRPGIAATVWPAGTTSKSIRVGRREGAQCRRVCRNLPGKACAGGSRLTPLTTRDSAVEAPLRRLLGPSSTAWPGPACGGLCFVPASCTVTDCASCAVVPLAPPHLAQLATLLQRHQPRRMRNRQFQHRAGSSHDHCTPGTLPIRPADCALGTLATAHHSFADCNDHGATDAPPRRHRRLRQLHVRQGSLP